MPFIIYRARPSVSSLTRSKNATLSDVLMPQLIGMVWKPFRFLNLVSRSLSSGVLAGALRLGAPLAYSGDAGAWSGARTMLSMSLVAPR